MTLLCSLQIHMGILRVGNPIDSKALAHSFIFRNGKRPVSSWMPVDLRLKLHGDVGYFGIRRGRISITAVATLETEGWVQKQDVKKGKKNSQLGSHSSPMQLVSANEEAEELDEKERLRRMRISKANKGMTSWNKGRKHSPETVERIRERTAIAMNNPEVKMKLVIAGHAQSDETKKKIGATLRRVWERRREVLELQEYCHFEWQNLIAEASRIGFPGEEELQWDSYKILDEQLHEEWLETVERRKGRKGRKRSDSIIGIRAPRTQEVRRKISAAISAKWNDPEYREKAFTGMSRYHGTSVGVERKPKIKQSSNTKSPVQNHPLKEANASKDYNGSKTNGKTQEVTERDAKHKDPSASSKLETMKSTRAQRETADTKKTEAIERARALIAEAAMSINDLAHAAEIPTAPASLVEIRKVIAEAIQSLESLKTRQDKND